MTTESSPQQSPTDSSATWADCKTVDERTRFLLPFQMKPIRFATVRTVHEGRNIFGTGWPIPYRTGVLADLEPYNGKPAIAVVVPDKQRTMLHALTNGHQFFTFDNLYDVALDEEALQTQEEEGQEATAAHRQRMAGSLAHHNDDTTDDSSTPFARVLDTMQEASDILHLLATCNPEFVGRLDGELHCIFKDCGGHVESSDEGTHYYAHGAGCLCERAKRLLEGKR